MLSVVEVFKEKDGTLFSKSTCLDEFLREHPHVKGLTVDGKWVFDGGYLFKLKDSQGVPLDISLHCVMVTYDMVVDWKGLLDTALKAGWLHYQVYDLVYYSVRELFLPKAQFDLIINGLKRLILTDLNKGQTL